jgi:hypothetical protein
MVNARILAAAWGLFLGYLRMSFSLLCIGSAQPQR